VTGACRRASRACGSAVNFVFVAGGGEELERDDGARRDGPARSAAFQRGRSSGSRWRTRAEVSATSGIRPEDSVTPGFALGVDLACAVEVVVGVAAGDAQQIVDGAPLAFRRVALGLGARMARSRMRRHRLAGCGPTAAMAAARPAASGPAGGRGDVVVASATALPRPARVATHRAAPPQDRAWAASIGDGPMRFVAGLGADGKGARFWAGPRAWPTCVFSEAFCGIGFRRHRSTSLVRR
jgi:hypothetical protein